jgi:hypothetical protein
MKNFETHYSSRFRTDRPDRDNVFVDNGGAEGDGVVLVQPLQFPAVEARSRFLGS